MLYTSKESSEHANCRFRLKKYDMLPKICKNLSLKINFQRPFDAQTVKIFFSVLQIIKSFFLKNGFNWTCQMLIKTKSRNLSF